MCDFSGSSSVLHVASSVFLGVILRFWLLFLVTFWSGATLLRFDTISSVAVSTFFAPPTLFLAQPPRFFLTKQLTLLQNIYLHKIWFTIPSSIFKWRRHITHFPSTTLTHRITDSAFAQVKKTAIVLKLPYWIYYTLVASHAHIQERLLKHRRHQHIWNFSNWIQILFLYI